eukprot:6463372-Amphidinium_carterae.1
MDTSQMISDVTMHCASHLYQLNADHGEHNTGCSCFCQTYAYRQRDVTDVYKLIAGTCVSCIFCTHQPRRMHLNMPVSILNENKTLENY